MKRVWSVRIIVGLSTLLAASNVQAQYAKMDAGLSYLVDAQGVSAAQRISATGDELQALYPATAMTDDQGRVLVDIYLDGSVGIDQFTASLTDAGASITGVNPSFGAGAVSAYVPIGGIETIAGLGGLNVMKLVASPQSNVGAVTSQGAKVMRSDTANINGFVGTGITVGVLSDSYNTSPSSFTAIRAANDIASGDLVAPKFVIDLPASANNTDEGRAMMQIVHDVAPNADLCFATAFAGEASFAANIRALRTNPSCGADVIVDDVFYSDEPFFSDGQVAQAVNDVSNSTVLSGKKVSYFSSAGNQQGGSGSGGSINVPSAVFSTSPTGLGNIAGGTGLNTKAAGCFTFTTAGSTRADTGGGWLDFGGGVFTVPVTMVGGGTEKSIIMQWDDPFYRGAVTTDLNWFMFDANGNCVLAFAANNFTQDNGIEAPDFAGGTSGTYRIMVARTTPGSHLSTRVRIVTLGGFSGGPFATTTNPTTFGHSAAASANSVAAYRYSIPFTSNPYTPALEFFSSPGPITIAFDALGNRLAVPETRKKPDFAAPDGNDTTFFFPGSDPDSTLFPNFFGTSAAAPHAAGVAALLLQKAGGPLSLTPPQIKSILQTTAPARKLPYTAGPLVKGWNLFDGFGLIDAVSALAKIP